MQTTTPALPPLAQALGRLRQPRPAPARAWPFAPRPAGTPAARHDFLEVLPEPALTGELPPARPAAHGPAGATGGIPGPEAARTYWFDL